MSLLLNFPSKLLFTVLVLFSGEYSFASNECQTFLNYSDETIDERFLNYYDSSNYQKNNRLNVSDTSNRVFLRALLSDALRPIFQEIGKIRNVNKPTVFDWLKRYEDLTTYQMVHKILANNNYVSLVFKEIEFLFEKTFKYKMEFYGLWSNKETAEFEVGVDIDQAYLMRKLSTSFYFIISEMNKPEVREVFGRVFQDAKIVFDAHTFSQSDFAYMMDFVFISYFHSITLLNVRPNSEKYLNMSDTEWLEQLMLPQAGERMSLIEKLSLTLRPALSGSVGLSFAALSEPLIEKDGKLVFSPSLKEVFRISNLQWQNNVGMPHELGLGCPAAFCNHGSGQSSLAIFNEVILHIFKFVSEAGINPENLYNPENESIYKNGDSLVQSLKFENQK